MQRYDVSTIKEVRRLRTLGRTYTEIKKRLNLTISKSTISGWCRNMPLPQGYVQKLEKLNLRNLKRARAIAWETNKINRQKLLENIKQINTPFAKKILQAETAKIALAMLCLGEASKSVRRTSFYFGNADPIIIRLFLKLLKRCFEFKLEKIRCTVQCRADQNIEALEGYWRNVTGIPRKLFYKTRIDPRTINKPTKNKEYKGVLRIDYFDSKVRLELESLAQLVYNQLIETGPVV